MSEKDRLNIISMLDAIDKVLEYSADYQNADEFNEHQRDFDAAMMNFIIIGEMVGRFSERFIKEHPHIEWFKIRGFRNIVAHNYFGIDAEEVWQIIQNKLPQLKLDLQNILDNLSS